MDYGHEVAKFVAIHAEDLGAKGYTASRLHVSEITRVHRFKINS